MPINTEDIIFLIIIALFMAANVFLGIGIAKKRSILIFLACCFIIIFGFLFSLIIALRYTM
jgi:hypothetical protein